MELCVHDGRSVATNRLLALATASAVCTRALRTQGGDVDGYLDSVGKHHRHAHRATNVDRERLKRGDRHGVDVAGGSVGATYGTAGSLMSRPSPVSHPATKSANTTMIVPTRVPRTMSG